MIDIYHCRRSLWILVEPMRPIFSMFATGIYDFGTHFPKSTKVLSIKKRYYACQNRIDQLKTYKKWVSLARLGSRDLYYCSSFPLSTGFPKLAADYPHFRKLTKALSPKKRDYGSFNCLCQLKTYKKWVSLAPLGSKDLYRCNRFPLSTGFPKLTRVANLPPFLPIDSDFLAHFLH